MTEKTTREEYYFIEIILNDGSILRDNVRDKKQAMLFCEQVSKLGYYDTVDMFTTEFYPPHRILKVTFTQDYRQV